MDWLMICYFCFCDIFVENYVIQKWYILIEEGFILC